MNSIMNIWQGQVCFFLGGGTTGKGLGVFWGVGGSNPGEGLDVYKLEVF